MLIFYVTCLVLVAVGAGTLALVKALNRPHGESHRGLSETGVKIKPWASIAEIQGYAKPETADESLKEAA
jgi:hypothetical protein